MCRNTTIGCYHYTCSSSLSSFTSQANSHHLLAEFARAFLNASREVTHCDADWTSNPPSECPDPRGDSRAFSNPKAPECPNASVSLSLLPIETLANTSCILSSTPFMLTFSNSSQSVIVTIDPLMTLGGNLKHKLGSYRIDSANRSDFCVSFWCKSPSKPRA